MNRPSDKLLEMIENGLQDNCNVVAMCIQWMSEDDIAEMMDANELSERFLEENI